MIVLSFASMQVSLQKQESFLDELKEGELLAIQAEKVNFSRTVIEENVDFIVLEVIEENNMHCKAPPKKLKEKINKSLLAFFRKMRHLNEKISFEFFSGNESTISEEFLERNSSVFVRFWGESCEIEYCFHGGVLKQEPVVGKIAGESFSQQFKIPAGYCQKSRVIMLE